MVALDKACESNGLAWKEPARGPEIRVRFLVASIPKSNNMQKQNGIKD